MGIKPETVKQAYEKGMPPQAIANRYSTTAERIESIIEEHDFRTQPCKAQDPEWLQEKLDEGYLPQRITPLSGVRSSTQEIMNVIREHDLDTSNASREYSHKYDRIEGVIDREDDIYVQEEPAWRDSDLLYRAYWEYYWSIGQIAEWCNTTRYYVSRFINKECDWNTRTDSVANRVRMMKVRGEPLERIQALYPYESANRNADTVEEPETQEHDITWSDVQ